MLVLKDKRLLGDGRLSAEESILRYKRNTEKFLTETYKLYDHQDLKNLEKRAGQRMHSSEFIVKVQRLNPLIWVEQQINYPDEWGFYIDVNGKKTYLSTFSKGWLPEFSAIFVDERDLPAGEIRGWRACLVRLMGWGALTWKQVEKTFGNSEGVNSERWLRSTREFRGEACCKRVQGNLENKMTFAS